jgi:hypothetical protein
MVFSLRSVGRFVGLAACPLLFAASCVFAQSAVHASKQKLLLPANFSGWSQVGAANTGTAPAAADSANADVLNEYGLKDFADSAYRDGNSKISVRAFRFADATGAYGAFTFYRKPGMKPLTIGNGAAGDAHEVVFWVGTTVIDATFDSRAPSFKALAASLPVATGSNSIAPTLPGYLPVNGLDKTTVCYAIGPASYARSGGVLPAGTIDFNRDAEVVIAQYKAGGGKGTLTVIEYPTPQMAIPAEKSLSAVLKTLQGNTAAQGIRRSGPLVAITSGRFSSAEAQALLAQVKYQADVTWNRGYMGSGNEVKKAGQMLAGIAYLTAILAACALLLGMFLGGGRALWRILCGKPASTLYEEEFISLNLSGWQPDSARKVP